MKSMMQELRHFGEHSGWDALKFLGEQNVESPINVLYLDHDPATCAKATATQHIATAITDATTLLATAWELHNPLMLDHYWDHGVITTTLCGVRIPEAAHHPHPLTQWVAASKGNYLWVSALVLELFMSDYKYRAACPSWLAHAAVALSMAPPALQTTEAAHTEPPTFVPDDCLVCDGDGVDAVASYRKHYAAQRATLTFPPGEQPAWLLQPAT